MNQSTDAEPGTHLREVCKQSASPNHDSKHLKLLDALVDKIIRKIDDDSFQPKVRDALKAIQLREKVAKASEAESIFWNLIDDIKKEEFSNPCPVPAGLQGQIKETILSLKDVVKNGILPLKAITQAFNETRSKQGRLTCRRMSSLLSAMEFTKAKRPNGSSAIIWDDQLLPQDTSSDPQNLSSPLVGEDEVEDPVCSDKGTATGGGEGEFSRSGCPPGDPAGPTNPMVHPQDGGEDKRYTLPPPGQPVARPGDAAESGGATRQSVDKPNPANRQR